MENYRIFTDATADLTPKLLMGVAPVDILPMTVRIGEVDYSCGSSDGIVPKDFYRLQREGHFATTSQINPLMYEQSFEPWLQQGSDILYLCFSTGLSGTYQSATLAMEKLQKQYPERKLICIDSLAAAAGEGMLVRAAAQKQKEGMTIDELTAWIMEHRLNVCLWFTIDTFAHLKHGGRVSATTAAIGTALQIKPLLHVDQLGTLQAVAKPRGKNKAIAALLDRMEQGWLPSLGKSVWIGHADDSEAASLLGKKVKERFPEAEVEITDIGPIIGAHAGPGTLALFYWGDNR